MRLNVAIINLTLGVVLAFLAFGTVRVWRHQKAFPEAASSAKARNADQPVITWENSLPSEKAFNTIVEKNLFAQSRSEYVPVEVEEEPVIEEVVETKIRGKRVVLYGVLIVKEKKSALITNPERGNDQPKYLWVKEGDKIRNLTVVRIEEDNIVVKDGRDTIRIVLNDEENKAVTRSRSESGSGTANVIVTSTAEDTSAEAPSESASSAAQDEYETVDSPFGPMLIRK
jgi:hypothetical protein